MPTNKIYRSICAFVCIALVWFPGIADASWLSDITGVNIDIPRGQVTFGPPRPDRIPLMLQNLPKDATQFFLNPAGDVLAVAIRQAKALAQNDCRPVPASIQEQLAPFLPPVVFNGVCWNTYGQRFSIDSLLLNDFNQGAVTLEDVIVFRDDQAATNAALWAHEMIHVQQYRALGLETFAHLYTFGSAQSLEGEAYSFQGFVQSRLNSIPPQPYYSAPEGWNPQQAIETAQYVQAAQQAINPMTCVRKENYPGLVRVVNSCPIPIRVVDFLLVNTYSGQRATTPCTTQLCILMPNTYSDWPEPAPWQTALGRIVW